MNPYELLLTIVGGSASLTIVLAFLGKALLTHLLEKDVKKYQQTLEATNQLEASKFNSVLKTKEYEHQIRFSEIYAKQASLIAELYDKLSMAEIWLQETVRSLRISGDMTEDEAHKKFAEEYNAANFLFIKNRIYFPEDVCVEIQKVFLEMKENVVHYTVYHPFKKDRQVSDEAYKKWEKAIDNIQKNVPIARAKLESKFRQLLAGKEIAEKQNE